MTSKTILIVGPAGPQGKTTLKDALRDKGYIVTEIENFTDPNVYYYSSSNSKRALDNGFRNGFIVINFTGKPFFDRTEVLLDYKIPEEELKWYIDYIEDEDIFRDNFKKEHQ